MTTQAWHKGKVLHDSVQFLKGVGPERFKLLNKLGIESVFDLLMHFPRDYQDWSQIKHIKDLVEGEIVTVHGEIIGMREHRPRYSSRRLHHILKVMIYDGTGDLMLAWYNQPYRAKQYEPGKHLLVTGKIRMGMGILEMDPLEVEIIDKDSPQQTRSKGIVPFYSLTEGMEQRFFRQIVKNALEMTEAEWEEILPPGILTKYHFMDKKTAIHQLHFPEDMGVLNQARERMVYEELLMHQLVFAIQKAKLGQIKKCYRYTSKADLVKQFVAKLPFQLTNAQLKCMREIWRDLSKPSPMNRLLQGDVGSGKTMVALISMLRAVENGYQSAIMVPTEVLAEQHYRSFTRFLEPFGIGIKMLTGSTKAKERKLILEEIKSGKTQVIIGTHALLEEPVEFHQLALVVIDEQHRFGVDQRKDLSGKGWYPDILVMTATPIPRTLSMSVYGDLDVSIIDEMPAGRTPVKTYWKPESQRHEIYDVIRDEIKKGRQCYIIYPLVETSDKLELKAAVQMHEKLQKEVFPEYQVGLIHGRMKKSQQQDVMQEFIQGRSQILVATTVIEVGIDVPNASIMLIEHPERFGLAQIHQLRGRIGRGMFASFCILMSHENVSPAAKERVSILTQTSNGFIIAEKDMELRGAGEILGTQQHGIVLYRLANMSRDEEWIVKARWDASEMIEKDPELSLTGNQLLKRFLNEFIGKKASYASIA